MIPHAKAQGSDAGYHARLIANRDMAVHRCPFRIHLFHSNRAGNSRSQEGKADNCFKSHHLFECVLVKKSVLEKLQTKKMPSRARLPTVQFVLSAGEIEITPHCQSVRTKLK
jgi:hypothetical protein